MIEKYKTQLLHSSQTAVAARLLRDLHPVVIPTETVYGIAADARSEEACSKIFAAKGRPPDNPLIVHFYSIQQIIEYEIVLTEALQLLLHKFAPGPLTVLAPVSSKIAKIVSAGLPTVAIRIPSHPIARAILRRCGFPLAAPSANVSGAISATTARIAIDNLYGGRVAAIVQGGTAKYGVESTIIRDSGSVLTIVRSGAITESVLRRYVHRLIKRRLLPPAYRVTTDSTLSELANRSYFDVRQQHGGMIKQSAAPPSRATTVRYDSHAMTHNSTPHTIKRYTTPYHASADTTTATSVDDSGVIAKKTGADDAIDNDKSVVPGSKYRHYQPRATVVLFSVSQISVNGMHGSFGRLCARSSDKEVAQQHGLAVDNRLKESNGLLVTQRSFYILTHYINTVLHRVNIIKRKRKGEVSVQHGTVHLPLEWQDINVTDIVVMPSIKYYMRYLYFFYWVLDSRAVKKIYAELPYQLDVTVSALGDRLVRSAL